MNTLEHNRYHRRRAGVPGRVGGPLIFPGHVGIICQATNATCVARNLRCPEAPGTCYPCCRRRGPQRAGQVEGARANGAMRRSRAALRPRCPAPRWSQDPARLLLEALEEIGVVGLCPAGAIATSGPSATAPRRRRRSSPSRPGRTPTSSTAKKSSPFPASKEGGAIRPSVGEVESGDDSTDLHEVAIPDGSPAAGRRLVDLRLPQAR